MMVAGVLVALLVVSVSIYYKIKASRPSDILSFAGEIMNWLRIPTIITKLGLTDFFRPPSVEVRNADGDKTRLIPLFQLQVEPISKLKVREDDVFLVTYPKSGTTWCQEILWLLCNHADVETGNQSLLFTRVPFIDTVDVSGQIGGIQTAENTPATQQRIMKTHLEYGFLPEELKKGKKGKIIYVARNPKDVCVSYYYFHILYITLPRSGTWPEFLSAFCKGELVWGDWFEHNLTYWKKYQSGDSRIYFLTYESLKRNFKQEVKSLAKFLDKELSEEQFDIISRHCSFESMSENKQSNYRHMSAFEFKKTKFFRKGQIGDWKNYFTLNQNKMFDELYAEKMNGSGLDLVFE